MKKQKTFFLFQSGIVSLSSQTLKKCFSFEFVQGQRDGHKSTVASFIFRLHFIIPEEQKKIDYFVARNLTDSIDVSRLTNDKCK